MTYNDKPEKPVIPLDISELEKQLLDMYLENTGRYLTDSGGAYGRGWEIARKAGIEAIRNRPDFKPEIWSNDDFYFTANTYNYLLNHLDTDDTSDMLNKILKDFSEKSELYGMRLMEAFQEHLEMINEWNQDYDTSIYEMIGTEQNDLWDDHETKQYIFNIESTVNTYNYDNTLDKILQYCFMQSENETYGSDYIMLQLHGGCDARGGYTEPKIFCLQDSDMFIISQADLHLYGVDKKESFYMSSDDSGYHWYYDGCTADPQIEKGVNLIGNKEKQAIYYLKPRNKITQKLFGSKKIEMSIGDLTY